MGNLFKKAKGTLSNYVGSVKGDANAIGSQLKGKLGSMSAVSNTFDQRIADGLGDLLTGATGIRTSNIPEISAEVMQGKSKNREARAKVLNNAMDRSKKAPAKGVKLQFPENFVTERGVPATVVENEDGSTSVKDNPSTMTNYIHFRSLERVRQGTGEELYDIFLYVPNEMTDEIAIEYEAKEKGLLEGIVGRMFGNETTVGTGGSELKQMMLDNAPGTSVIKQAAGKTLNPLKFQLFQGVGFRTYSYSFQMRASNASESAMIKKIIYAFKISALPGTEGPHSRIYTFPNEWAIRYHGPIKDYVEIPMVTICTSVTANYAPDSFVHNIDGSPIAVDLKVDFQETSTLDRDKFKERVTPFGNEGTQSREDTQELGSTLIAKKTEAEISEAKTAVDAEAAASGE